MTIDFRVAAAGVVFGAWALATFLHWHTDRFRERVQALDPLLIVPEWRFFGTNPGRFDFYLLYRDRLVTNEITDWIEIPLIVSRPWHAFAFNPSRRSAKAIMDVVIHLSRELDESRESIVGSMPYLTLLNHVSAQPSTELSTHRQFLLLQSSADTEGAEPALLLASELHELVPDAGS